MATEKFSALEAEHTGARATLGGVSWKMAAVRDEGRGAGAVPTVSALSTPVKLIARSKRRCAIALGGTAAPAAETYEKAPPPSRRRWNPHGPVDRGRPTGPSNLTVAERRKERDAAVSAALASEEKLWSDHERAVRKSALFIAAVTGDACSISASCLRSLAVVAAGGDVP